MNLFIIIIIFEHNILLIIKNKQNFIRYCNASSFVFLFKTVILKHYVNILSIIAILLPSASCNCCCCWHLVVVVGVLASAPRCKSCRHWRLVVIAVLSLSAAASLLVDVSVGFCASSLLSLLLVILSSVASRSCCHCRLLVVDVVVVGCLIINGVSL